MLYPLDYVVIALYLAVIAAIGLRAAGRQRTTTDYFLGGRDLPWWAVSASIVATETSTLTVIGVPAVAYGGNLTFLQLTVGYLLGRIVVALWLLPRYARGDLATAYAFLGQRFGDRLRVLASVTFMGTRLLADGVRLFATAIPIKLIADSMGVTLGYPPIILGLALITVAYTYVGGLRAVVWIDAVQLGVYVLGSLAAVVLLLQALPFDWWATAVAEGKTRVFEPGDGLTSWLTSPYALPTALAGGALFSMASHGADQLIVQRVLACRSLRDAQWAMVASGVGVVLQFALFLGVGLLLWVYYGAATPAELGLARGDEVFPRFIIEGLPAGLSGLLLAAILAAAMSTLSSSLNALAGSTVLDVVERVRRRPLEQGAALRLSRVLTLAWGAVFTGFALLFEDQTSPVVELGLGIAGFTYGGLLGAFVLGLVSRRARQVDAVIAFVVTIGVMVAVIFGLYHSAESGAWVYVWRPSPQARAAGGLAPLAWPLYTVLGTALMVGLGSLLALRHRGPAPEGEEGPREAAAA